MNKRQFKKRLKKLKESWERATKDCEIHPIARGESKTMTATEYSITHGRY